MFMGKSSLPLWPWGWILHIRPCSACNVLQFDSGWHNTVVHGAFGAAAVSGKLLGLDQETPVNALGLVHHQAEGNLQCIHDGALAKRMGSGFAVRDGIMAALMAQ